MVRVRLRSRARVRVGVSLRAERRAERVQRVPYPVVDLELVLARKLMLTRELMLTRMGRCHHVQAGAARCHHVQERRGERAAVERRACR
eukprot:scaffold22682_cov57-Phaeocystis_antarctica.AAC.3